MDSRLKLVFTAAIIYAAFWANGCTPRVTAQRTGNETGSYLASLDETCGKPPDNIKSDEASKLRAALSGALKTTQGEANAVFEREFRSQLEQTGRSSTFANDIAVVQYSVCEQCLTLALSPAQCDGVRTEALSTYKEIAKKN